LDRRHQDFQSDRSLSHDDIIGPQAFQSARFRVCRTRIDTHRVGWCPMERCKYGARRLRRLLTGFAYRPATLLRVEAAKRCFLRLPVGQSSKPVFQSRPRFHCVPQRVGEPGDATRRRLVAIRRRQRPSGATCKLAALDLSGSSFGRAPARSGDQPAFDLRSGRPGADVMPLARPTASRHPVALTSARTL
jgi:hypothetical protein